MEKIFLSRKPCVHQLQFIVIADVGKVVRSIHVKIGPQVGIYTVNHLSTLLKADRRRTRKKNWEIRGELLDRRGAQRDQSGRYSWLGNVVVASGTVVTKSFWRSCPRLRVPMSPVRIPLISPCLFSISIDLALIVFPILLQFYPPF